MPRAIVATCVKSAFPGQCLSAIPCGNARDLGKLRFLTSPGSGWSTILRSFWFRPRSGEPSGYAPVRSASTTRGLWRSLVSALDWGSRGPGFKSRQPDSKGQVRGHASWPRDGGVWPFPRNPREQPSAEVVSSRPRFALGRAATGASASMNQTNNDRESTSTDDVRASCALRWARNQPTGVWVSE